MNDEREDYQKFDIKAFKGGDNNGVTLSEKNIVADSIFCTLLEISKIKLKKEENEK
ncbi:hypothetical protein [Oceanobacillus locisalsi]|uniref:Uncharacterized protein n=1 Tax=Oceanobacillus locisalsi TaxID=546107 RepID=A0ABW3NDL1_9BACI